MDVRALATVARAGDIRARLRAVRDGQAAVRLSMTAAALDLGVLDALDAPMSAEDLATRLGHRDVALLGAFLDTLVAHRLLRREDGRYRLTRRAAALRDDSVARAMCTAFSDFHTGVYRDLGPQLAGGGPGRDDVTRQARTIAELSRFAQPFVESLLRAEVESRPTRKVLDVGCGSGMLLATMLEAAPSARGTGVELDPVAAEQAGRNLADAGLAERSEVLVGDAHDLLTDAGTFDLALLANVVYYLPVQDRPRLLRLVRGVLAPGGRLVVVTTALTGDTFSRHFDLLLRAQEGAMELPSVDALGRQVAEAGFVEVRSRQVSPGEPLFALTGTAGPR